jgi:glycosyltransferase involved in cell wall biosynthesis
MRPLGETGVQTHFQEVRRLLMERGGGCDIVTPFSEIKPWMLALFGLRRLFHPLAKGFSVWWYRHWHYQALKTALQAELTRLPEVVSIYAQCPLSAEAALRTRRNPQTRVVLMIHFNRSQADEWAGKGAISTGGKIYRKIKQLEADVLSRVDLIICPSAFMKNTLTEQYPAIADRPIEVIPYPLASSAGNLQGSVRQNLVTLGSLEPRKNQRYLLNVLAEARKLGWNGVLDFYGDGPDRSDLRRQAEELGLASNVRFLGFRSDVAAQLEGYQIYLHAALIDNLPMALIEAQAAGLPIIAGAVGGIPEIVSDEKDGLFWHLDDPQHGAKLMIQLLNDVDRLGKMSIAAREHYEEYFAPGPIGDRLFNVLTTGTI